MKNSPYSMLLSFFLCNKIQILLRLSLLTFPKAKHKTLPLKRPAHWPHLQGCSHLLHVGLSHTFKWLLFILEVSRLPTPFSLLQFQHLSLSSSQAKAFASHFNTRLRNQKNKTKQSKPTLLPNLTICTFVLCSFTLGFLTYFSVSII